MAAPIFTNVNDIMKIVKLTLPEWACLQSPELEGRDVFLHVHSASVMEAFERCNVALEHNVSQYTFHNYNDGEDYTLALHYAPLVEDEEDKQELLKRFAVFYVEELKKREAYRQALDRAKLQ